MQKNKISEMCQAASLYPKSQPAARLPPGSQCCRGSSKGHVWRPWAGQGVPCSHPTWRRRRRSGSGRLQPGGVMGWSAVSGRLSGSITSCSNPDRLRTEQRSKCKLRVLFFPQSELESTVLSDRSQQSTVDWERSGASYLPAKAPHPHRRGWEGRRARCNAPCTPALASTLARPTA